MSKIENQPYYSKKDIIGDFLRKIRHKEVFKHVDGYLVDIACGDNILCKSYNGKSTGVDFMDYGNADIIVSDYSNMPFEDKSIDTLTIIASLNYFENPVSTMKECNRIMKDNGKFIITMPNIHIMKIWHLFRESWAHKPGLSKKEIKDLANSSGFKVVKVVPFMFFLNNLFILQKK